MFKEVGWESPGPVFAIAHARRGRVQTYADENGYERIDRMTAYELFDPPTSVARSGGACAFQAYANDRHTAREVAVVFDAAVHEPRASSNRGGRSVAFTFGTHLGLVACGTVSSVEENFPRKGD